MCLHEAQLAEVSEEIPFDEPWGTTFRRKVVKKLALLGYPVETAGTSVLKSCWEVLVSVESATPLGRRSSQIKGITAIPASTTA